MPDSMQADPRYPIGKFIAPDPITYEDIRSAMHSIADMPSRLRDAIRRFDQEQLNTPYRDGGWTVRQLVHHIADSHMAAFFRMRKALTEDFPEVPGYEEKLFATLPDVAAPVEWSLEIIEALHGRWIFFLKALTPDQFQRGYTHAERGPVKLDHATLMYGWHGRHHVAHILALRKRQGW